MILQCDHARTNSHRVVNKIFGVNEWWPYIKSYRHRYTDTISSQIGLAVIFHIANPTSSAAHNAKNCENNVQGVKNDTSPLERLSLGSRFSVV